MTWKNGPVAERGNRASHLMTEAEARGILFDMEREVPSAAKRRQMAEFYAKNLAKRLSAKAVALYRLYANEVM